MSRRELDLLREKLRCLLGDSRACHNIGARYATGDHGDWPEIESQSDAVRWYERGARRGDAECQFDLGFMLIAGEGVAQDHRTGLHLLEQAASRGHCEAIRLLADLFTLGAHGVAADPVQAQRWSRALVEHLERHPDDKRLYER